MLLRRRAVSIASPDGRRHVADDRRLVAGHVAGIGVLSTRARSARRAGARRRAPRPSVRRRRHDAAPLERVHQAVGIEPLDVLDDDAIERRCGDAHPRSARDRCSRRAARPCRCASTALRDGVAQRERRRRVSGVPSPSARSARPATGARETASASRDECSRPCAARHIDDLRPTPRQSRWRGRGPPAPARTASPTRPSGQIETPSNGTKCDGPTSTIADMPVNGAPLCRRTRQPAPSTSRPACGATIARGARAPARTSAPAR